MSDIKNLREELEKKLSNMEAQVNEIPHNTIILMVALENMDGPFKEFGSFNRIWIRREIWR